MTTCDICGDVVRKDNLTRHHRSKHTKSKNLMTTCDICGDVVKKVSLPKHRLQHTNLDSLITTCNICGIKIKKSGLKDHRLRHTNPDSLMTTCDICGIKIRKSSLKDHHLRHTNPDSFMTTCDICGDVVRKNSLKNHRSKHTDPDSLMTTCDICREIVRKDCLNEHHLTHTDPDSLMTTCDICGVKIRKSSLKQHKNGFLCLYDRDVSYKWENVGKNIAEIVLTGQDWKWKPKILLKKLKPSLSVDQRSIYPEIVIYQDNTIDTIIDLKSAIYSLQYKDLNIYPHVAKHVIFWVLKGDSCTIEYKNHTLQFISSNDLINLLFNHNVQLDTDNTVPIQNLVTKIRELTLIPEDIQRLRTASLQDYV